MNCGRGWPWEDLRKEERSGQRERNRREKVFFFSSLVVKSSQDIWGENVVLALFSGRKASLGAIRELSFFFLSYRFLLL